ncbi:MAG: toll/interleukin-1 receptor domain-containing protein [Coleofasciculus sp. G1-WW12-02]|uniref:toll/interleukin-1 receptor domain-containing protein n=1 Tax=Coleofasciculus sp. G1-WW12-02 TaxID=3068483 RepID=UPI0033005862
MKAFISHSSIDKPFVERLATDLRTREGIDAWLDKWEIRPGDRIPDKLEDGLANPGILVLVLSPDSVAQVQKAKEIIKLASQKEGDSFSGLLNSIYQAAPHLKR